MRWLLFLLLLFPLTALAEEVSIPAVPSSAEQFVAWRDEVANTPEGGAACLIAAMLAYGKDPVLGRQCFTLILDPSNVGRGNVYQGYQPGPNIRYHLDRLDGYRVWPYLGYAYVRGANAQNRYAVAAPYVVSTYRQRNSGTEESGRVKVFVELSGGFRPRPVTLQRNDKGIWKVLECSSMFLNVEPPAGNDNKDPL